MWNENILIYCSTRTSLAIPKALLTLFCTHISLQTSTAILKAPTNFVLHSSTVSYLFNQYLSLFVSSAAPCAVRTVGSQYNPEHRNPNLKGAVTESLMLFDTGAILPLLAKAASQVHGYRRLLPRV